MLSQSKADTCTGCPWHGASKTICEQCGEATAEAEASMPEPRKNKFGAHRVTTAEHGKFDSKKEHRRFLALRAMEQAGQITGLIRQQVFILAPPVMLHGRKKPALKYVSDFVYFENGQRVVEDTKSEITRKERDYRIKMHLMVWVHGIEVRET